MGGISCNFGLEPDCFQVVGVSHDKLNYSLIFQQCRFEALCFTFCSNMMYGNYVMLLVSSFRRLFNCFIQKNRYQQL